MFSNADVIFSYTRSEALADGVLVDVTARAKEVGFRHPTAVTAAVWAECVMVPAGEEGRGQDETGRLHDVLFVAMVAVRSTNTLRDRVTFEVKVLTDNGSSEVKALWIQCGPGDDAEPVLTIMMQGED